MVVLPRSCVISFVFVIKLDKLVVKMTDNKALVMASANGLVDKSEELQKEILMEKLRSKTSQYKNLSETSKAVRMAMLVSFIFCTT